MSKPAILLASASPRRRDLLREHGFRFRIEPADIEEVTPPHFTVAETALFNAKRKAMAVAAGRPRELVMGVDTLVALAGALLGKPRDLDEAFDMLSRLSGQTHEVHSGVWLVQGATGRVLGFVETSRVRFRRLNAAEIRDYMRTRRPLDKAGAYAAQHDEMGVIEAIEAPRRRDRPAHGDARRARWNIERGGAASKSCS